MTQSLLSYFRSRVVHLVHDPESFMSSMTLNHPFHLFPSMYYSSHAFSLYCHFPPHRVVPSISLRPHLLILPLHVLGQNLWFFFNSSVQFTSFCSLLVFLLTFSTLVIYTEEGHICRPSILSLQHMSLKFIFNAPQQFLGGPWLLIPLTFF